MFQWLFVFFIIMEGFKNLMSIKIKMSPNWIFITWNCIFFALITTTYKKKSYESEREICIECVYNEPWLQLNLTATTTKKNMKQNSIKMCMKWTE